MTDKNPNNLFENEFILKECVCNGKVITYKAFKLFESSDVLLLYSILNPGYEIVEERHSIPEYLYSIKGCIEYEINNNRVVLNQMHGMIIEAYQMHSSRVIGAEPVYLLTMLARNQYFESFF